MQTVGKAGKDYVVSADAVNESKGEVEPFAQGMPHGLANLDTVDTPREGAGPAGCLTALAVMVAALAIGLSALVSAAAGRLETVYPQDPALPVLAVSSTALLSAFFERRHRRTDSWTARIATGVLITAALGTAGSALAIGLGAIAPVRPGFYAGTTPCGPVTVAIGQKAKDPRSIVVDAPGCGVTGQDCVTVGFDGAFGYYNPGISVSPSGYRGHVNLDGSVDGWLEGVIPFQIQPNGLGTPVTGHAFRATRIPPDKTLQAYFSDNSC
jgi:hypothetical protein